MEPCYPTLRFDLQHDCFVVWLRWVALEDPPSPEQPAQQGIRVELQVNRNPVLGPTIVFRRDLAAPVYLRANAARTREVLRKAGERGLVDLGLIIHGSIANAPFAALYQLRDYVGEAIDTSAIPATPLLQLQPSTPADRWQVAGQVSLRARLELSGSLHLTVIN
ncbi:hypothetical protein ACNOYE_31030 [Nannocystaceae bacterium ST9]